MIQYPLVCDHCGKELENDDMVTKLDKSIYHNISEFMTGFQMTDIIKIFHQNCSDPKGGAHGPESGL